MRKMLVGLALLGLAGPVGASESPAKTRVCITADTKDESGFSLPGAKAAQDILKKLGENIQKRKTLTLVEAGGGCVLKVKILGYRIEETGRSTVLRQNPYNPHAVTGSAADTRLIVMAEIAVGGYTTRLETETMSVLWGQGSVSAASLAKALEKWVAENADAIKAQMPADAPKD